MPTCGRGTGMVGYNLQMAVDTEHHLIVAHEVTNVGHDRTQLANMAGQAKAALVTDKLDVVADRLVRHMTTQEKGRTLHLYWASNCKNCAIRARCTSGVRRKMSRWEHQ